MASMVSVSSVSQWTIREQLVLASAVQQSGDKNWVSVSRAIKPLMEYVRPTDYFSQKNCALQYAAMLDKVPNRRKRRASEDGTEMTEQLIVRELSEKRINELNKTLAEIRSEYTTLSKDIELLERGELDDRRVPELWERLNSDLTGQSSPSKITAFSVSNKPITIPPLSDPQTVTSAKENAILTTKQTELVSSAAVNAEVTVTPNASLHEKISTVKKEQPATDTESPLVRFPSLADDKVLSPMQTPLPTPSGQPLSANLHIILQERNKAVDNLHIESNNSTQLKTTQIKTLDDTSANTSLAITPPQFSSSPITVPQSTTTPSPTKTISTVSKPPIKESLNASLSKSVPKMAYLSKSQAVSQPSKDSMLQSLVSAPGNPLPTTATDEPAPVTTSPSVAASIPLTTISSHVVSPLATASVTAPLIKTPPVQNTATPTSQVGKPLVIVQPVSSQVSTKISPSTSIAVSSPIKSTFFLTSQDVSQKPSTDTIAQKKPVSGHTTASVIKLETRTVSSPKSEAVKDIKSLLALPSVTSKQPVKIGEATQPVKQATERLTTVKQDSFNPQKGLTTPIKAEPEIIDILSDTLINTPVSSPSSAVRTATLTPPVVMETQYAEPEDDTPTKVKKGHSILKRSLLARSRKRKHEDEGPSVESTDTEEDGLFSQTTSTVSSPAPSQCGEMDADTLRSHKQWKKGIMIVWRHAAQHKFANFFLHRVREEDAPGYMDVILCPTDLSSIKRKVECGQIKNDIEFQREMLLMFQNAFMYNSSDHEVYDIAQSMKWDVMENLQTYLATQAQLQLVEDPVPTKTLRGRRSDRDQSHEDFSPAIKKRKTRMDDRD